MANIVVEGLAGIRVEVVLHSISEAGKEIITFLVDHPRIVHAEELKHRQFSYSAASSRAIPSAKMAEQLTGMPVSFGKNQSGMQAGGEHFEYVEGKQKFDPYTGEDYVTQYTAAQAWEAAKADAVFWSEAFARSGYHKQVYNRLTEPFQMIRVLVTATETANFYWLRDDKAADPTLAEQARCMRLAHEQSTPQVLKAGEWHLPFLDRIYNASTKEYEYGDSEVVMQRDLYFTKYDLDDAIKMSCARCAATSFRNTDYDLAKSLQVYDRLVNGDKVHSGALEHSATPMPENPSFEVEGITALHKTYGWQSGNFSGWIQYRQLVPGHTHYGKLA